ncbi:MAG: MATE family efflux transporter [Myxococcales bacterium FL481]|nr:MAG: MATE family efflux transporter [Myxococcales bacterium FL481]
MNLTDLPDHPPRILKLRPEAPLVKRVLYLGSFVMLAMVTQFFVNAADSMMVGRLEPAEATASQAALGLGMPLFWAVGGFFSAISYGTQAMTARRFAERRRARAGQVLFNSILVAIVSGALGSIIGYTLAPLAVDFLAEASHKQRELAAAYTQIRALGVAGMVMTFSYKAFFDGIGRTYVHLIAAAAMNLINVVLNYMLIYGVDDLGIPQLGLHGAAWASTMSTYLGLAIMVAVSVRRRYRGRFMIYRPAHLDVTVMRTIVRLMLPSGSASVILMTGFLLFMKFVGQIDAAAGGESNTYSAATAAIMNTAALCFMPLLAFGTATATAVSQSLGAGKANLAARYGWESVRVGLIAVTVVGLVFWVFPEHIIAIWAPNDPAVVKAGVSSLKLVATCLPMMVLGLVLSQALYGAGANLYVMVAEGFLHVGVLVPLSWLLGPQLGFGMEGVWTAAVVYVNCLGIAMGLKFLSSGWRKIRI